MIKAFFSFILILIFGMIGLLIGIDFLGEYPELGPILGIAVAGGCIVYFQDTKK
ncbi:MAG TPA: hypothetical protein IAD31_04250 [Candidatus Enterenecus faecium]|uniref:Uncharacterized protein n=1 Tax=Candidatus Enterenecus faecium TaxID=2840780 RepID=A0A9D0YRS5_9FIRM|nr:hypothetical protein [Candidatus Enterenecus faecium]